MPKETFFALPEEKKKLIMEAAENEFRRTTLDKALISNIVRDASIARGSFYQYFDDIDDLFYYLLESFKVYRESHTMKLLRKHEGNIFTAVYDEIDIIFDDVVKEDRRTLFRNIHDSMSPIIKEKLMIRHKEISIREDIIKTISSNLFKNPTYDNKEKIFELLGDIKHRLINKAALRKLTKEEALSELEKYIDLITTGIGKEIK